MFMLDRAIKLAVDAHRGQLDLTGHAYIRHPLRVMDAVAPYGEDAMIVGVLHDVVEDTEVTLAKLYEMHFSADVIRAVDAMTHRKDEVYEVYVARLSLYPLAVVVKVADLRDNLGRSGNTKGMRKRYIAALKFLAGLTEVV